MESHSYISFALSFIKSSGPFGQVGSPNLFYWLSVAYLPGSHINDGKVLIISRDRVRGLWREHTQQVSFEQARRVTELLRKLGIPERSPDVEGVVDTSDSWSHISFQVRMEERHSSLEISMQSSGFEGRDAELLRELFRYLFSIAGYDNYDLSIWGAA